MKFLTLSSFKKNHAKTLFVKKLFGDLHEGQKWISMILKSFHWTLDNSKKENYHPV